MSCLKLNETTHFSVIKEKKNVFCIDELKCERVHKPVFV